LYKIWWAGRDITLRGGGKNLSKPFLPSIPEKGLDAEEDFDLKAGKMLWEYLGSKWAR